MADSHREEVAKLENLYANNPEGRVFTHLAEAYRKAGEPVRAREILEQGLTRHADYASAHVVMGRVLLDIGDRGGAASAFRRVLELDRHNLIALRALGDMARDSGRIDDALERYRELLSLDPSDDRLRTDVERLTAAASRAAEAREPRDRLAPEPTANAEPFTETEPELSRPVEFAPHAWGGSAPRVEPVNWEEEVGVEQDALPGDLTALTESPPGDERTVEKPSDAPADEQAASLEMEEPSGRPADEEAVSLEVEEPSAGPADERAVSAEVEAPFAGIESEETAEPFDTGLETGILAAAVEEESAGFVLEEETTAAFIEEITAHADEPAGPQVEEIAAADVLDEPPVMGEEVSAEGFQAAERWAAEPAEADAVGEPPVESEPYAGGDEEPSFAEPEPDDEAPADLQAAAAEAPSAEAHAESSAPDDMAEAEWLSETDWARLGGEPAGASSEAGEPADVEAVGGRAEPESGAGDGQERPAEAEPELAAAGNGPDELVTETMAELYTAQGLHHRAAEVYRTLLKRRPYDERLRERLRRTEAAIGSAAREALARPPRTLAPASKASERAVFEEKARDTGGAEEEGGVAWLERVESAWTGRGGVAGAVPTPYAWTDSGQSEESVSTGRIADYFRDLLAWRPAQGGAAGSAAGEAPESKAADEDVLLLTEDEAGAESGSDELLYGESSPGYVEPGDAGATDDVDQPAETWHAAARAEAGEEIGSGEEGAEGADAQVEDDEDLDMFRSWLQSLKK